MDYLRDLMDCCLNLLNKKKPELHEEKEVEDVNQA